MCVYMCVHSLYLDVYQVCFDMCTKKERMCMVAIKCLEVCTLSFPVCMYHSMQDVNHFWMFKLECIKNNMKGKAMTDTPIFRQTHPYSDRRTHIQTDTPIFRQTHPYSDRHTHIQTDNPYSPVFSMIESKLMEVLTSCAE
jgi:hypothetical protein